ncbi:toll/interleukin-1 receptor domain-containing protein [Streptomyces sp. TRM 70351]|uniref:toll/interleukin-1 receptor domain-containing protein n=1 Tax=Streptomyces sp. TRM 70351 TaxID=3116552 RepID=UPI002E7B1FD3|nr:toll/interleukin-1 receptor domain-containing protein [Streptomyces sp. TRM 70351]MEE1930070.1 toll/interleukin-1 receptor domain-containing protein [Streptomyces sp. TRM 70351]
MREAGLPRTGSGGAALRIFISHGAGKDACVEQALELIVPPLQKRGYTVFTDMDSLRVGDAWHPVLYEEMYLCDAAIVLLGPETVRESDWVRREADVLMGRHIVRSLRVVLPGFLGTQDTKTARKRGFSALLQIQTAMLRRTTTPLPGGGDVQRVTDWLVAEFAPVGFPTAREQPFHTWTQRIAGYLRTARDRDFDTLTDAAAALGCLGDELMHMRAKVGGELFLAHRLLDAGKGVRGPEDADTAPGPDGGASAAGGDGGDGPADEGGPADGDGPAGGNGAPLPEGTLPPDEPLPPDDGGAVDWHGCRDRHDRLPGALAALRPVLAAEPLAHLAEEILPGWVHPAASDAFVPPRPDGGGTSGPGPVLLLGAYDDWTAEQHVQRALYREPDSYFLAGLPQRDTLPGDESSPAEELLATCLTALRGVFRLPPRMPLGPDTVRPHARVREYLVISSQDYPLRDVAEVVGALHRNYPWLVVVVLTPQGVPGEEELRRCGLAHAVPVRPALSAAAEQRAYDLKTRLDAVVQPAG